MEDADLTEFTLEEPQGRVLIIAGSDPSGGAGIQADLKTCAAFGAYGMTAITALTVQNTQGVRRVELMSPDLVREQALACLEDIGADVIKIGMLGNRAVMEAVADVLESAGADALSVLDPVMVATSGDRLMEPDAEGYLRDTLLPLADIVTPNAPEAAMLTGMEVEDSDALREAGDKLLEMGAGAAVLKGGHLKGSMIIDILMTPDGVATMTAPRIQSRHTHGTGCTLASAIAANMSLGSDIGEAVSTAREFVFEAIRTAPKLGQGNGPLNHGLALHSQQEAEDSANPFAALKALKGGDG